MPVNFCSQNLALFLKYFVLRNLFAYFAWAYMLVYVFPTANLKLTGHVPYFLTVLCQFQSVSTAVLLCECKHKC